MSESNEFPHRSHLLLRWLPGILLLLLSLHHLWLVYSFSINIPYQDDIYDFLQFINLVDTAESMEQHLRAWFTFYNDHRTTASRVQVYLAYLFEGYVNFRTQAVLGNLSLLLILVLFYLGVRHEKNRWWILLVPALLMLTIRPFPIVAWGQPTLAYFWVYLYAFASLFALHRVNPKRFALAVVLAILASFTFATGLAVWLLGLACLLHQSFLSGRLSLAYVSLWLLCALALILLWFTGFAPTTMEVPNEQMAEALRNFDARVLVDPTPLDILLRFAGVALVLLGRAITETSVMAASLLGLFMVALLLYISLRHYKDEDIRLLLCAWFAMAAVAFVTAGRALILSPEFIVGTNARYSFLSVMAISTLFVLVQTKLRSARAPVLYVMLILGVVFYAWTYVSFKPRLQEWAEQRYKFYNRGVFRVFAFPDERTAQVVAEAHAAGRIILPCKPAPGCEDNREGGN